MQAEGVLARGLGAQVAALIARPIIAGEIEPGKTLPTEAELCQFYGVSRTTIRDALRRLHGKGLVVGTPRGGTTVQPTARWNQFDSDILAWRLEAGIDPHLVRELREIRFTFEPEACRIAAERATEADNARIRAALEAMAAFRNEPARVIGADLDFHLAIVDATHNRFFITLGAAVKAALRLSFLLLQERPNRPDRELGMHEAVAEAIRARRGEDAANAMRELIALSSEHAVAEVRRARKPSRL